MIDWKARVKNPAFWLGLAGCVMSPILAYNGMAYDDLTTWGGVGNLAVSFFSNPYLIGSTVMAVAGFLGVTVDTSTPGIGDAVIAGTEEPVNEPKPEVNIVDLEGIGGNNV